MRNPVLHLVAPGLLAASETPLPRETITHFLRRTGWATRDPRYGWRFKKDLPTVCQVNGEYVLRKQWRTTRIRAADCVMFTSLPRGGGRNGTKQIVGLAALIAVAAFAVWAPAGLFGLTAGSWQAAAVTGAIGIGGDLKIDILESE